MRQSLLSRLAKRSVQQGQIGQTIVIMAFGFIVLLAFVGIVTDVSLMFVRYTTLRRAVDAAAVAAAGQVRRAQVTQADLTAAGNNKTVAQGYAFARSVANINLAARQFIEFYGISPSNVSVDSCDTLQQDSSKPGYDLASLTLLQCRSTDKPRKLVRVTAQLQSPTVFLRLIGWGTVTLEASSVSETAVLDVVLMFDAAESMLKQTTYNDWKNIPATDASGNLTNGTPIDKSLRYLPVRMDSGPNWKGSMPLYDLWSASDGTGAAGSGNWIKMWRNILTNMTQQDIFTDTTNFPRIPFTWDGTTATAVALGDPREPRKDCQVRFYPYAETVAQRAMTWEVTSTTPVAQDLQNSYGALLRAKGVISGNYPAKFDGFIPAYDYFGCCNDPNGDNKFDDLVCQPFKKVRDATESFLDRVDFVRGDRVALVTFDRSAYVIDPDGDANKTPPGGPQLKMITSQDAAVTALRHIVGVRAEPTYYADTDNDGLWNAFVTGGTAYNGTPSGGKPLSYDLRLNMSTTPQVWQNNTTAPQGIAGYDNTKLGLLNDYAVRYNCLFDNATLQYPFSIYSSQAPKTPTDYNAKYGTFGSTNPVQQLYYPYDPAQPVVASRWPTPLAAAGDPAAPWGTTPAMNPNLNLQAWNSSMKTANTIYSTKDLARQADKPLFSYEFRAACGGNNIAAALREGNNALLDPITTRSANSGAVWVMVLLGDGAAGASDPVQRNGPIAATNPYGDPNQAPFAGSYGAYGLCPTGQPGDQAGLTAGWTTQPPRCSDDGSEASNGSARGIAGPVSRHFCPASATGTINQMKIDLAQGSCNIDKYDVDDYARDWADYIGLNEMPRNADNSASVSPFCHVPSIWTDLQDLCADRTQSQLPTIFTIGFGLDFPEAGGCGGDPAGFTNINDCLGQELLRYIADVGDNNAIDTDYEQDYLDDGVINGTAFSKDGTYGQRGPCEAPIPGYANADAVPKGILALSNYSMLKVNTWPMITPFPKNQSCGNYYNAPTGAELTKVFEDIAGKMFTRITK